MKDEAVLGPSSAGRRFERSTELAAATAPTDRVAVVARVYGRVQGVGYRYWTRTRAESLRLKGYVRNLTDGSVEALFIGETTDVARMLTFCEDGPPTADVCKVETCRPGPQHPLDIDRFRRAPTRAPGDPL